ncbi:hypothetical protein GGTG_07663 [Gaeumannomyces tritici R3-111a-1]|uniref:CBM1 domain-containing protein n=1 Tax=Gaeumannomyces tritici (strain R3-111a-1) TaxID=644352 RepID=J3P2B6_GAET3|nr:hypothetical protein GGTG_07663 [Gaeumannomyces tritici R3-111a-1]EJT73808.1 hypothetical protein GGTG_07663 [Gaeumannomyces tritici R3-111a-1]
MRFSVANVLAGTAYMASAVAAGTVIWDGRFNDLTSSTDLNKWSWGSQVGPYQYYIHGSSPVASYINLSPSYKNPADAASRQGAKFTLDSTAYWNGQNMRRIELIPQTTAAINKGKVYYHFSIKRSDVNPPATTREHQIAFFESHFTELKSGWLSGAPGTSDPALRWMVNQQTKWSVDWAAGVWHNVAYEIDFGAGTVGFWHSTGADPLTRTVAPVSVSTSSNGADWHLGVLELPRSGYPDAVEDFYFSGVYIETGSITTAIGTGGGGGGGGSSGTSPGSTSARPTAPATTTSVPTTAPPTTTTSPPSQPGQTKFGQCGGNNYSGPTSCIGSTCSALNEWYHQCV